MDQSGSPHPDPHETEERRTGGLLALMREIGDLKRVTSAGRDGSIATRLFQFAWAALASETTAKAVAESTVFSALAATRLGDLDRFALMGLGLDSDEAREIGEAGFEEVAGHLDPAFAARAKATGWISTLRRMHPVPHFVAGLVAQPRAGVTCPGKPRIVLQPAENHAEHCLAVAVYGVLLARRYGADPTIVFLAGLSHHLHNATIPDSGFTGEMLLGPHLEPVMRNATDRALNDLESPLREEVIDARAILVDAGTPEGRAFHAADVIDRVLETEQHLRAARLTMDDVLGEMALVHDGPVKSFHERVLEEVGLP